MLDESYGSPVARTSLAFHYSRRVTHVNVSRCRSEFLGNSRSVRTRCSIASFNQGVGGGFTSSGRDKMAAAKRRGRKAAAKKGASTRKRSKAARSASARKGARTRARNKAA